MSRTARPFRSLRPATLFAAAALVALGSGAPARADEPSPPTGRFFEQHDKNRDGKVAADEFTGDREVFGLLDKNGDGTVTPEEVGLPADFRPQPKPPEPPGADRPGGGRGGAGGGNGLRRLKEMDKDGDGKVSREEWTGAPERFDRLDRNKDGALDASDVAAATRDAYRERWKQMDKDGDGRVSRDEFRGDAPFDTLDRNRDGFLDDADRPPPPEGGGDRPGRGPMDPEAAPGGMPEGGGAGRGPGGRRGGLTPEALRRFDANADGKVTKDEFPGNEKRFAQLDRNGDGALTPDDVERPGPGRGDAAAGDGDPMPGPGGDAGPKGPGEARRPKRAGKAPDWRGMDRDGNGKISREEFRGGDEDWRHLDRNQDGWIAGDEIPAPPGGGELARAVLEELVRRDDKNGDGRIARDEFGGPAARFDALDRNQDGHLDPSDG
jgi:Ca2+-binding EF-hand superfamily protein